MGKTLVIAEKPSVAGDIARAIGGLKKVGDHYEGDSYIVASAVGHLLELKEPAEYEVKRGKWSFANLPVIPSHFDLAPIKKSETKLNGLKKLLKSKEVDKVINACDAGREGELIFRYIMEAAKSKKPIYRLWLQSMTKGAILDAFKHLRTDAQMQPLADAAKSRSEADWLVGINGTRAMTAFNSKDGGFFLTTVGRVQTPTLALVVNREEKIRSFVPRNYWEVHADFKANAGIYEGKYFDPAFKKSSDPDLKAERLWSAEEAQKIADAVRGKKGTVTEISKPSTSSCPALYDLTTLQREANSRFGFSAKTTLSIAQALYEKHKLGSPILVRMPAHCRKTTFLPLKRFWVRSLRPPPSVSSLKRPCRITMSCSPKRSSIMPRSVTTSPLFRPVKCPKGLCPKSSKRFTT